jgi:GDP-L-fucose synthase
MKRNKVFVAGHKGMVGSAIVRLLEKNPTVEVATCERQRLDLRDRESVADFLMSIKPDRVFLAAAKVGGIFANNSFPADFLLDNLLIQSSVIDGCYQAGVERMLFLGSSCIYPAGINEEMSEDRLLSGHLEPTNEPYAVAKIAGIKLCESFNRQYGTDFRSVMPCNLYGPGDNYHPENSHVIPAMIRRFHDAKVAGSDTVEIWGSGKPLREFLHVDDLARACGLIMDLSNQEYSDMTSPMTSHVNIGQGKDISIKELALLVSAAVGFQGEIVLDKSKPDGVMKKLMRSDLIKRKGWKPLISLEDGLKSSYRAFLQELGKNKG